MKPLLLLGASSLVGHWLPPRLAAAGYSVHAVSRQARPAGHPAAHWHQADLLAAGQPLAELLAQHHLTKPELTVITLFPLWHLPPLLAQLPAGCRLIAFGSTSAVGKADSPDAQERALAQRLVEAENALFAAATQHGIATTLVRPTLIYDGVRDANISRLARLLGRYRVLPLVDGAPGGRQPVHADDLAAACVQILQSPATVGQRYDLPGGDTLSYRQMVERIAQAHGWQVWLPTVPAAPLLLALRLLRRHPRWQDVSDGMVTRQRQDLLFDAGPAQRDFGYAPGPFRP